MIKKILKSPSWFPPPFSPLFLQCLLSILLCFQFTSPTPTANQQILFCFVFFPFILLRRCRCRCRCFCLLSFDRTILKSRLRLVFLRSVCCWYRTPEDWLLNTITAYTQKVLSICRTNFHTWLSFLLPSHLPPTFAPFCSLMATSMHTLTPSIPLKSPYFRPLSLQQIQRLHFPLSFTSSSPGISCSAPPVFCQHPPDVTVRCADTNFNLLDEANLFSSQQQDNDFTCVMKFGGSSVASAERMREVADLICSFPEERPIIVLSAMGKATNNLLLVLHSSLFFLASYLFFMPYKRMDRDKFL